MTLTNSKHPTPLFYNELYLANRFMLDEIKDKIVELAENLDTRHPLQYRIWRILQIASTELCPTASTADIEFEVFKHIFFGEGLNRG